MTDLVSSVCLLVPFMIRSNYCERGNRQKSDGEHVCHGWGPAFPLHTYRLSAKQMQL